MSAEFVEAAGFVHMMNPTLPEYTLCGDAFDLGSDEDGYEQRPTSRRAVSCPVCAQIIRGCAGVRTYVQQRERS